MFVKHGSSENKFFIYRDNGIGDKTWRISSVAQPGSVFTDFYSSKSANADVPPKDGWDDLIDDSCLKLNW